MNSQSNQYVKESAILGTLLLTGLLGLGYFISNSILTMKAMERTVEVKGLSEREINADVAIWPITFNIAENDLVKLSTVIKDKNTEVIKFLKSKGFDDSEVSISAPSTIDKLAREYDSVTNSAFRYSASSTVTVYTNQVEKVKEARTQLGELGKLGIAIGNDNNGMGTQYLYSKLNDIKPAMIEEATKNARQTAEKFAKDSNSKLGKIRRASQGTFSIEDRDSSTAYIKKVRVVSTVEYFLSD
ncbi:MAG: SIMPL domain-containing protein [Methylophilaceae bacterium]